MGQTHTYAIFSTLYAPHTGGVETFTQRLAHQLSIEGNHVFVVTSRLDASAPAHTVQDDGVEVYRLPSRPLLGGRLPVSRKNAEYERMLDELANRDVERVLVNVRFYRNSLEGVRFAKRIGAPVIVLDHGSAHLTLGNAVIDRFVEQYEHAITGRVKKLAPAFAGISRASVDWLAHFGIETSMIIPNAIDVEQFRSAASERDFRAELDVKGKTLVAFVGRLEPEKGALAFAQAALMLGDSYVLALAGDGSQRAQIEGLDADNVILLGQLGQSDLSALLRDADVFCLPTRSEGFCTSLLEAAAQGTVPVMPHVGGTDEVMGWEPTRFGVMLEDNEPGIVARAIEDATAQGEKLACDLVEYVDAHCSWDATAAALEKSFSSLG